MRSMPSVLEDELGVEPDDETTALLELHFVPGCGTGPSPGASCAIAAGASTPRRSGTPSWQGGRPEEVADLLSQQDCRLLTLVGPGGSGKTRLAIQIAIEQSRHVAGTVSFVALAAVREPAGVACQPSRPSSD